MMDGDLQGHGVADEDIQMEYFLDKQNIVCAMMPAPFLREEVEKITAEEV